MSPPILVIASLPLNLPHLNFFSLAASPFVPKQCTQRTYTYASCCIQHSGLVGGSAYSIQTPNPTVHFCTHAVVLSSHNQQHSKNRTFHNCNTAKSLSHSEPSIPHPHVFPHHHHPPYCQLSNLPFRSITPPNHLLSVSFIHHIIRIPYKKLEQFSFHPCYTPHFSSIPILIQIFCFRACSPHHIPLRLLTDPSLRTDNPKLIVQKKRPLDSTRLNTHNFRTHSVKQPLIPTMLSWNSTTDEALWSSSILLSISAIESFFEQPHNSMERDLLIQTSVHAVILRKAPPRVRSHGTTYLHMHSSPLKLYTILNGQCWLSIISGTNCFCTLHAITIHFNHSEKRLGRETFLYRSIDIYSIFVRSIVPSLFTLWPTAVM